jgi:glycosyltransferase involved in cell wall biosynthesis
MKPKINFTCTNAGWIFEAWKSLYLCQAPDSVRLAISNKPLRDADAWIFPRAPEIHTTPDPQRTVVQFHDTLTDGRYAIGGCAESVRHCLGFSLTHPEQEKILTKSGIDLSTKRILFCPTGAREIFQLREDLSSEFIIAWVGRPYARKRLGDFIRIAEQVKDIARVILLGANLERTAKALCNKGIECEVHPVEPIDQAPTQYKRFDCVVITSEPGEGGPVPLFESLATGVPVVSTPTGWAPHLIKNGENGFLIMSAAEATRAIMQIYEHRKEWFNRRESIRNKFGPFSMERWAQQNIRFAHELAKGGPRC